MKIFDQNAVHRLLDYDGCIEAVGKAMEALSREGREQPLRSITTIAPQKLFGVMPGTLPGSQDFGAKLVSVFPTEGQPGRSAHQGLVVLFDGSSGSVQCVADAGALTHVRTGCASAVATETLARRDAQRLGIFGCGAQARSHIDALMRVRPFAEIGIWGRSPHAANELAAWARTRGATVRPVEDAKKLASESDVICTVTSASDPIVEGAWIRPGTHVNLVGSSYAGPREVDSALVARSLFFVDYRPSALAAAAEFLTAKGEGMVSDDHIVGEIGDVLGGRIPGRRSQDDITVYKSLGHIAQDLAAVRYLMARSALEKENSQ